MRIGVFVLLDGDIDNKFFELKKEGFDNCQLGVWDMRMYSAGAAAKIKAAQRKHGVEITALWCGYSDPVIWNFREGPSTIGLVPRAYRARRTDELLAGAAFARDIGVKDVITHAGFIPESPSDPDYRDLVSALKYIAGELKRRGQNFLFETGQETPVTLLRVIGDVDTGNLGINLDPANLILYGKANPVDALDIIGKHVRGVHAKDGEYPLNPYELGEEKPLGCGRVDFEKLLKKLVDMKYGGVITIEREISGEQQRKDIRAARIYLQEILCKIC